MKYIVLEVNEKITDCKIVGRHKEREVIFELKEMYKKENPLMNYRVYKEIKNE